MTVERRDNRSNRRRALWGARARTGVVALMGLGTGAGCGQAYLRPEAGQGRAVPGLAWGKGEPVPGRGHAWGDPALQRTAASPARRDTSVSLGLSEAPHPVSQMATGPLFYTPTVWNGWKVPATKPGEALAAASGRPAGATP